MRRKRELSHDEHEVWRSVTRSVRPYHGAPPAAPPRRKNGVGVDPGHEPTTTARPSKPGPPRPHHAAAAGDPGLDRRAARGRLPIEASLDLHGYYQAGAHSALRAFLAGASARGQRCVLVITGKGAPTGAGILRRRFLEWIDEPDNREKISRVANAHQRHGGAGAFYVFLKPKP